MQHKYKVFLVCATGIFITVFDTSASIVALPTIALEFGADLTVAQWVIIGNSLTIAALLVPVGRLSDVIGRKLIYVTGSAVFALGAVFAWRAESIYWLIGARCLVGIGSAMTQGTAMAIVVGNFAPGERGRMLGMQMGGVGLGAIAGPALGGLIVGTVGWRMLFAVTVFAMLVIGVASQRILRKRPQRPAGSPEFDWLGAILFSCMFVAGLLTLTLGPRAGWHAPGTIAGVVSFVFIAGMFIWTERRHPSPMLDFKLFQNGAFSLGALAAVTLFMGMSATRFLTPFFLQGVKGYDATSVGAFMLPAAIVTAICAPFAGRLADRFGVRLFANIGFGFSIIGLIVFSTLHTNTPTSTVVAGLMMLAFGMALFGAPNSAAVLNSVPAESYGIASGFVNLCRNSGNVIGIAFGTAIVTLTMGAAGYAPSLTEVTANAEAGLFVAFTEGVRSTCYVLISLAVPVLGIVVFWSIRSHRRRHAELEQSASK